MLFSFARNEPRDGGELGRLTLRSPNSHFLNKASLNLTHCSLVGSFLCFQSCHSLSLWNLSLCCWRAHWKAGAGPTNSLSCYPSYICFNPSAVPAAPSSWSLDSGSREALPFLSAHAGSILAPPVPPRSLPHGKDMPSRPAANACSHTHTQIQTT